MNFFQRLAAPTPAAEKRIQVICLVLEIIVAYLIMFHIGPQVIMIVVAGVLAGMAVLSQHAVEDVALIKNAIADPSTIFDAISQLSGQFTEFKTTVTAKAIPDPSVLIKQVINELAIAGPALEVNAPAPVVDAAPAAQAAPDQSVAPSAQPVIEQPAAVS